VLQISIFKAALDQNMLISGVTSITRNYRSRVREGERERERERDPFTGTSFSNLKYSLVVERILENSWPDLLPNIQK
jgi:hypothetical protein